MIFGKNQNLRFKRTICLAGEIPSVILKHCLLNLFFLTPLIRRVQVKSHFRPGDHYEQVC